MSPDASCLDYGLGLRTGYYTAILEQRPAVDWFEIVSENYMVDGGKALYYLDAIGEHYPLVVHGVSLSVCRRQRRILVHEVHLCPHLFEARAHVDRQTLLNGL